MEDLDGTWIDPKKTLHTISRGVLHEDTSAKASEVLKFRADRDDKHGPSHFSIGFKQRKGARPSTLRRCLLRDGCELEWTSPCMKETWQRFLPQIARCEKIIFVGPDGTEVTVDVTSAKNARDLHSEAYKHFGKQLGHCFCYEVCLAEVATDKVLTDQGDISSGDDIKLRVSTHLEYSISCGYMRFAYSDGSICEADLSGAYQVQDVIATIAAHTSRPPDFVKLFITSSDGKREQMRTYMRRMLPEKVVVEVCLQETVSELWSSQRLVLQRDAQDWPLDLSDTWSLQQLQELVASETGRPRRLVRFSLDGQELKKWEPPKDQKLVIAVQTCPTVAELLGEIGVKIINSFTGDEILLDTGEVSCLKCIQELREHIAQRNSMRATGVTLLANDKPLWDSDPFDLCMLSTGGTIGVCLRSPTLCEEGQHEIMNFLNNGYNDQVCIHCGPLWLMEGRTEQPLRRMSSWRI